MYYPSNQYSKEMAKQTVKFKYSSVGNKTTYVVERNLLNYISLTVIKILFIYTSLFRFHIVF